MALQLQLVLKLKILREKEKINDESIKFLSIRITNI